MELTHADIADIIRLIDESSLDELVLEVGGVRIEARRKGAGVAAPPSAPAPPAVPPRVPIATPPPATTPSSAAPGAHTIDVAPGQSTVTAPMVGTFYRRPSPDAPPFVEVGSRISAGDPLCLVEVMKLYTTITAEHSGTIVAIGAEDATLVEYAQVLFVIEPD